jgi:hypothetical protein
MLDTTTRANLHSKPNPTIIANRNLEQLIEDVKA